MIKVCDIEHLPQLVEIAFKRNSIPTSNCAFCSSSAKSITRDFEFIINSPDCLMVGAFCNSIVVGMLGCFVNPDNNWVDCCGPFFRDEWDQDIAKNMFDFAKSTFTKAVRFNFFFNKQNKDYHSLMGALSAERGDNEYILLLDKADYKPQEIKAHVVPYTDKYEKALVKLHDTSFPDVYVTGRDIIAALDKNREVFCVLDENGVFAGYGVLKFTKESKRLTAEIFAVESEKRGKGYGWALLNAVLDAAFNKYDGEVVDLVVERLNTHAKNLYYSCGFRLSVENEAFWLKV